MTGRDFAAMNKSLLVVGLLLVVTSLFGLGSATPFFVLQASEKGNASATVSAEAEATGANPFLSISSETVATVVGPNSDSSGTSNIQGTGQTVTGSTLIDSTSVIGPQGAPSREGGGAGSASAAVSGAATISEGSSSSLTMSGSAMTGVNVAPTAGEWPLVSAISSGAVEGSGDLDVSGSVDLTAFVEGSGSGDTPSTDF